MSYFYYANKLKILLQTIAVLLKLVSDTQKTHIQQMQR